MKHQRVKIRREIKRLLLNQTGAKTRVFLNRATSLWGDEELPALMIYTPSWTDEITNESPRLFQQSVEVRIEVAVKRNEQTDDYLDSFSELIERLLLEDSTLSGTVWDIVPIGGAINVNGEGAETCGGLVLMFTATFGYEMPDQTTSDALDELKTVHNQYSLGGVQLEADQTSDTIRGLDQ